MSKDRHQFTCPECTAQGAGVASYYPICHVCTGREVRMLPSRNGKILHVREWPKPEGNWLNSAPDVKKMLYAPIDPPVCACPLCEGVGCQDCHDGLIRIITRRAWLVNEEIKTKLTQEIKALREFHPLSNGVVPCGICGQLMQNHSFMDETGGRLCPLSGPSGQEVA